MQRCKNAKIESCKDGTMQDGKMERWKAPGEVKAFFCIFRPALLKGIKFGKVKPQVDFHLYQPTTPGLPFDRRSLVNMEYENFNSFPMPYS